MDQSHPANWNYGVQQHQSQRAPQLGRGGWNGGGWRKDFAAIGGGENRMNMSRRCYAKRRFSPFAPRNTTSFIIRSKRSGGVASLVSPMTPAVLASPVLSPLPEVLVDMAKAEWGVDGYGSMNGLIRLRSEAKEEEEDDDDDREFELGEGDDELSEIDVEQRLEMERRLDLDLSRFEMLYNPVSDEVTGFSNPIPGSRLTDQRMQIARLNEEKLRMNEKLSGMEREMQDLKRRIQCLETFSGQRMAVENVRAAVSDSDLGGGCGTGSEKSVGDHEVDDA